MCVYEKCEAEAFAEMQAEVWKWSMRLEQIYLRKYIHMYLYKNNKYVCVYPWRSI